MSDLYNDFPNWGESGEYPPNGFFYEGGDQVNEKHLDALWDGIDDHISNINDSIRGRIDDLYGNIVLDDGLVASDGSGTREIDVSATSGAYVEGHRIDSVSATTITYNTNNSGSRRNDTVYLTIDGTVEYEAGATDPPSGTLAIAELDINPDDSILSIRDRVKRLVDVTAGDVAPSDPSNGDIWMDTSENAAKVWFDSNGSFDPIPLNGQFGVTNGIDMEGEPIIDTTDDTIDISGGIVLSSQLTNPDTDGEILNNNGDIVVQTGGTELNLSNVGTSSYTDEDAQDAVGTIMTGSTGGSVNYDDGGNTITVSVDESYSFNWTSNHNFTESIFFNSDKQITENAGGSIAIQANDGTNLVTFTDSSEVGLYNGAGDSGAIFLDANGDVVAVNSSGQSTVLT